MVLQYDLIFKILHVLSDTKCVILFCFCFLIFHFELTIQWLLEQELEGIGLARE